MLWLAAALVQKLSLVGNVYTTRDRSGLSLHIYCELLSQEAVGISSLEGDSSVM